MKKKSMVKIFLIEYKFIMIELKCYHEKKWYKWKSILRTSRPDVFCEKVFFSCEFCEISKNTFFYKTPLVAASVFF